MKVYFLDHPNVRSVLYFGFYSSFHCLQNVFLYLRKSLLILINHWKQFLPSFAKYRFSNPVSVNRSRLASPLEGYGTISLSCTYIIRFWKSVVCYRTFLAGWFNLMRVPSHGLRTMRPVTSIGWIRRFIVIGFSNHWKSN